MSELSQAAIKEQSMARLIIRRFFKHRLAGFAIAVLVILILLASFAYLDRNLPTHFNAPAWNTGLEPMNWAGTSSPAFCMVVVSR